MPVRLTQGMPVPVLLILFDAKGEKECIGLLARAIEEEHAEFLSLSDEIYLINTERDSEEVFNAIKRKIGVDSDNNESLIVLTVPEPYIGRAPAKVKLWLSQQREKDLDADGQNLGTFLAD